MLGFVKECWHVERVASAFTAAEVVALSLSSKDETFFVLADYRSPNSILEVFFSELEEVLIHYNQINAIIAGELNIDIYDVWKLGV